MTNCRDLYLKDLRQLPYGTKVIIYGTGEIGQFLWKKIKREREDINVVGFIDSFRSGQLFEVPIFKFSEFCRNPIKYDIIIIATIQFMEDIRANLENAGINSYLANVIVEIGEEWLHSDYTEQHIKTIEEFFSEHADKRLWRRIMNYITGLDYSELHRFIEKQEHQYLDYISLSEEDVVIEGGVFDGLTTAQFAERVGKGGKVYGFDPLGTKFTNERISLSNVEIIPLALSGGGKGSVYFMEEDNFPGASFVIEASADKARLVEAISIDEFVFERRLSRMDYIKLDVEGYELEVLKGAELSIRRFRPWLAVALYHKLEHFFEIPIYLNSILDNYQFKLGKYGPGWTETILYALPLERK
jgi:FkbM family methyltransferase